MVVNARIKEDSSRAISALLCHVLEATRQGDVDLAKSLGFDIDTIRNLDKLKADQISNLSHSYLRDKCALGIFQIDTAKMSRIIEIAAEETRTYELIDEYLGRGACKLMMRDLFGLRSTQVANRKRLLNIPTIKGRLSVISVEEEQKIYDAWLASIEIGDIRERYLAVAVRTGLSLSKIYRVVLEIEEIEVQKLTNSKVKACA